MKPTLANPRVLVLTRNLPPLIGGMERLVWHMVDELRAEYRVHVIGPRGCRAQLPPDVTCDEFSLGPLPWFLLRTLLAGLWFALRQRPALVLAGSGLTAPFVWLSARVIGARCAVYLHGLDVETTQPMYRLCWRPFFRRFDQVLVNSRFTRQLAIDAGVAPARITVLWPGVALPDTRQRARQRANFRKTHGLGEDAVLLYVGRITARKGLAVFAECIFPAIAAARPDSRLIVVGDAPAHALLRSENQRQRTEQVLAKAGLRERVLFLGEYTQDDPELNAAYFAADALIFPVQSRPGDNEGFGMVALEAAAHGLLTVAFAAGGVADAVAHGLSGRLIEPGDNAGFAWTVVELLASTTTVDQAAASIRFAQRYAWPAFGGRLRACLRG